LINAYIASITFAHRRLEIEVLELPNLL